MMFAGLEREKNKVNLNFAAGGAFGARYDRVCPFLRRGQNCRQHSEFLKWCTEKEQNTAHTQLLTSSTAVVMMTYREDTIQKVDCPFLHPTTVNSAANQQQQPQSLKATIKAAAQQATNRNANMIEALVDYFLTVASQSPGDEARRLGKIVSTTATAVSAMQQQQPTSSLERTASNSNALFVPDNFTVDLERDDSCAIIADGIVSSTTKVEDEREQLDHDDGDSSNNQQQQQQQPTFRTITTPSPFYQSLNSETKQQWKSADITFTNFDFCSCFASAVAVLARNPELFGRQKVRALYLANNRISTDGLSNLIKALKATTIGDQQQVARKDGAIVYGSNTAALSAATKSNAAAAIAGTTTMSATLASQIALLDVSFNALDTMHFLFDLKVQFPRLLSLFVGNNPITRRPDYRELVRRTIPQLVMLDGESLRKPPLSMAFPTFSSSEFDTNINTVNSRLNKSAMKRAVRLFAAAYLRSWETCSHDFFRDDDATEHRDAILHPSIVVSLTVQAGTDFSMPGDVMTDEQIAAAIVGPGMRGGRVGTKTRQEAQQLAEQRVLEKQHQQQQQQRRRQREESGGATAAVADNSGNNDAAKFAAEQQKQDQQEDQEQQLQRQRSITKLDAKTLKSLPVALTRNSRNIAEGRVSIERIVKGRLECVELLCGTVYLEGLHVSHHTQACVCDVTPICLPTKWEQEQEEKEAQERQRTHAAVIAAAKAAAQRAKKQQQQEQGKADQNQQQQGQGYFGKQQQKQPDLFLVTVHGVVSWRTPSLTGQRTVSVAADHTFTVVATEEEDFFAKREAEMQEEEREFIEKQERRVNRQQQQQQQNDDDDDDNDEVSSIDSDELKTPQQIERDSLLRCLKGFRLCNHAVTLRPLNRNEEEELEMEAERSNNKDSDQNDARNFKLQQHFYNRFLFDPLRASRVMRLAHVYGTTPRSVAKVLERTNSDAACEAVLMRSLAAQNQQQQ